MRDPLGIAGRRDYLAHRDDIGRVLEFYTYPKDDDSRPAPDNWVELLREEKDGNGRIVLADRDNDSCVEVTYRNVDGMLRDWSVRALVREDAYRLALDQDDHQIARGAAQIFNERHPRPGPGQ